MGVVAKVVSPQKRSVAPRDRGRRRLLRPVRDGAVRATLISGIGWYAALLVLAATAALIVPLAAGLPGRIVRARTARDQSAPEAFGEAFGQKSFHFLFWSYFVCGVHTAFIALHLPSYCRTQGFRSRSA